MDTKNKLNLGLLIAVSALPSSALQADPKLEPVYLANVALYLNDEAALRNLPFVSKNGQEAFKMLKKNPIPLTERNRHLFPNIETQVLFSPDDKVFTDGIQNHVYGYPVDYDFFLLHKDDRNATFPYVIFTQKNRKNHTQPYSDLVNYDIPEGVTSLGRACFEQCWNLETINLPESVTSLDRACFAQCQSLETINLPEGITSLGRACFFECVSLEEIIIPNSVTSLGEYCFASCENLKKITISNNIRDLGKDCFRFCYQLQTIIIVNTGNSNIDDFINMLRINLRNSLLNPNIQITIR